MARSNGMIRATLAWLLIAAAGGCASPPAPSGTASPTPKPYVRAARSPNGTHGLEVALRALRPARGHGPTIWLVGVTHLGTADYYARLQRFLDTQALVLFEGIGATNRSFQLQRPGEFNLQPALAAALGLRFQLQTLDYDRPHFQNSDLSLDELSRVLGAASGAGGTGAVESGGAEFNQLLEAMQGTGFLGAVARIGVAVLAASPRLQAATQVALVDVLSELPADLPQLPGIPAGFRRLLEVLIEERNHKVVQDVHQALRRKPRLGSIAILYGAGHMTDLEQRLRTALRYRPAEEEWLTAFAVDVRKAGLSDWELSLIRSWVGSGMKELRQTGFSEPPAPPGPRGSPRTATPPRSPTERRVLP